MTDGTSLKADSIGPANWERNVTNRWRREFRQSFSIQEKTMRKTLTQINLFIVIAVSWCQIVSTSGAQEATEPKAVQPSQLVVGKPMAAEQPSHFYNYYMQKAADGTAASMYPSPVPVPARVGHTHYTYQPLLPHELMYRHSRVYYTPHGSSDQFYSNSGKRWCGQDTPYTETSVIYTYGSNILTPMPFKIPSFNLRGLRKACVGRCK